ncbi:MAG: nucleotidyltransferase domain-containing protein [Legionella sp.]|jgi:predicted nucleotidyltransferase|nr:nucleotidyltransferase domain-containing protein [Legionella sp.]
MLKNCGLKPSVIQLIQNTLANFPEIKRVILYGSRAIGNYRTGSDIDLTILLNAGFSPSMTLLNKISLALDDLDLIYTFDLSFMSEITNKNLINHINQFGLVFYARDKRQAS